MADTPELKKIKKIYGEKFKNLCRSMFPVILEQEGTLLNILEKRFYILYIISHYKPS